MTRASRIKAKAPIDRPERRKPGPKKREVSNDRETELLPDRQFFTDCIRYLDTGEDPPPDFVKKLLHRYFRAVSDPKSIWPLHKFNRQEQAALIDYHIIAAWGRTENTNRIEGLNLPYESIISIINRVHDQVLRNPPSVEALAKAHSVHGMRVQKLKEAARRFGEKIIFMTPELQDEYEKEQESKKKKRAAYEKAKKDLFG